MADDYESALAKLRAARRESERMTYYLDRQDALDAYGGKCIDCGKKTRDDLMVVREYGTQWGVALAGKPIRSGAQKFKWLRRNKYPDGFIVLCRECKPRHRVVAPPQPEATS